MPELLTRITIPGQKDFKGLMDWGSKSPEEMVGQARRYAACLRAEADAIERVEDVDFQVDLVRGSAVQKFVRTAQQSRIE